MTRLSATDAPIGQTTGDRHSLHRYLPFCNHNLQGTPPPYYRVWGRARHSRAPHQLRL